MNPSDLAAARRLLELLGLEPGDNLVVRRGGYDYEVDLSHVWKAGKLARRAKQVVQQRPLPGGPIPTTRLVGHEVKDPLIDDLLRPRSTHPLDDCKVHRVGCFVYPTSTNTRTDD